MGLAHRMRVKMGKGLYCQLYVLACGVGGEAAYQ